MEVWYRSRIFCGEIHGVRWAEVRAHMFAKAISDYISAGIARATFSPAIFDPRFFPYQFDPKQSVLSAKDSRSLYAWMCSRWPDWSLGEINLRPPVTWLEVLNPQDQELTLQILESYYGLTRN